MAADASWINIGLIRYVYVIIDLSKGMSQKDWKPHRCAVVTEEVQRFVADYFDQNPISQVSERHLLAFSTLHIAGLDWYQELCGRKAQRLVGQPGHHIDILKRTITVHGEPSLQNALEMAKSALKTVPSYGSKEIVVVYGSLTTTDPGDIFATITALQKDSIRCSLWALAPRCTSCAASPRYVCTNVRQSPTTR